MKQLPKLLLLWLFACSLGRPLAAQRRGQQPNYLFTATGKRYISNADADSVLYTGTARVFEAYKMPVSTLQEKYGALKTLLFNQCRLLAVAPFTAIELEEADIKTLAAGSAGFERIRNRYLQALEKVVARAFSTNKVLQRFLYFPDTDRITYFNSLVRVQPNGKLLVTETIIIYNSNRDRDVTADLKAAGEGNNEIKRGIVRAFPTVYLNKLKLFQNTTFNLKSVERAGEEHESWRLEKHKNGYLLYIGKENYRLPAGNYTYKIVYETGHQLKLLPKYDELMWNVTGNGWNLRIDSAACTLILPPGGARYLSNACYTGKQADSGHDCTARPGNDSVILFKTQKPLLPYEGFTIGTSWNKGLVQRAAWSARAWQFTRNNLAAFLLPFLALLFGIYNFIAWWRVGRDPDRGVIFPLFYPPAGYSPAAMGYIYRQKFDGQLTSATVIDLAVKNLFRIDVDREGWLMKKNVYHIKSSGKTPERSTYHDFRGDADGLVNTTVKKGHYNEELGSLHKSIRSYCESNYKTTGKKKGFFTLNNHYMAPGNLLTFLGCMFIFFYVIPTTPGRSGWQVAWMVPGLIICILVQTFFYKLISTYTMSGRKVMDSIEGFRMYLVAADEQRINAMNPPVKTPELYEKYMPFAVALDCEIEWGKQFEDILETAVVAPGSGSSIHSSNSSFHSSSFSSSFASSFSGAISSASSPPSSSSGGGGSFGGGSSGGGGGGGGGGGW